VVNQLDDSVRENFPTGRPLEDTPELQQCKICKKGILKTVSAAHVEACVKAKNEKLKKKKEQKEAREREKKLAAKGDEKDKDKDKDEEGDTRMEDEDEDEDVAADKKGPGGLKSTKKSAGKKIEVDDTKKGKKRKADGDAEKGPKQKKKKEEPKPKAPKQKGILFSILLFSKFPNLHSASCRSSESKASPPCGCGCGSAIDIDSFLIRGRLSLLPLQILSFQTSDKQPGCCYGVPALQEGSCHGLALQVDETVQCDQARTTQVPGFI
jgi:hypothetical protein